MKKIIQIVWICIFLLGQENFLAQDKAKLGVGLYNSTTFDALFGYGSYGVNIGIKKEIKHGSLCFDGSFEYTTNYSGTKNLMKNQYLGLSFSYILWSSEKRWRPYITFKFLTQIHSNYKDGLLTYSYYPIARPMQNGAYSFHAGFYQNTPFIGRFSFGFNFKIIDVLLLNIGLGLQNKIIRFKKLSWTSKQYLNDNNYHIPYKELPNTSLMSRWLLFYHFEIGLSYTIPFQRHSKTE